MAAVLSGAGDDADPALCPDRVGQMLPNAFDVKFPDIVCGGLRCGAAPRTGP